MLGLGQSNVRLRSGLGQGSIREDDGRCDHLRMAEHPVHLALHHVSERRTLGNFHQHVLHLVACIRYGAVG